MQKLWSVALSCATAILWTASWTHAQAPGTGDGCSCISNAPTAQVTNVSGTVMASGADGWSQATAGTVIGAGGTISVGTQSSGAVALTGCTVELGPDSVMTIEPLDTQWCARTSTNVAAQQQGSSPNGGGLSFGVPEQIFGTLFVGAIAAGQLESDRPASP
jgi:hypothetical protein